VKFAELGSGHWHAAWAGLQAQGFGLIDEDPATHECWQYLGTWLAPEGGHGRAEFRHRNHPQRGRLVVSVYLSPAEISS
jgi:hypothetical protein